MNFLNVDAYGNPSQKTYPVQVYVGDPAPSFVGCPPADGLCPTGTALPTTPPDPNCGYSVMCPRTKTACPDTQLYCPDGSPCYGTGTCPTPYPTKPAPQCPDTVTCPSGTRTSQGCPEAPYYSCTPIKDDCGGLDCPGWAGPTPVPTTITDQFCSTLAPAYWPRNDCGTPVPPTGPCPTAPPIGCPDPSTICPGEVMTGTSPAEPCPGTKAPVCPSYCHPTTDTITCGTATVVCPPITTEPVCPPTPAPVPCDRVEIWKHAGGDSCGSGGYGAFQDNLCGNSGRVQCNTPTDSTPGGPPAGYTDFKLKVDGWIRHGEGRIEVNGVDKVTYGYNSCGGSRNEYEESPIWGRTFTTYGDIGPSIGCAGSATSCYSCAEGGGGVGNCCDQGWYPGSCGGSSNPGDCVSGTDDGKLASPSCIGSNGANADHNANAGWHKIDARINIWIDAIPDPCGGAGAPATCDNTCPASITNQYCSGRAAPNTCMVWGACTGTGGVCSCVPFCPANMTNLYCAGQQAGADGCGSFCTGTGPCVCNAALQAQYCTGTTVPGTSCPGTRGPGCVAGSPVCGGTCPVVTPPPCYDQCSPGDQTPSYCDPYYGCGMSIYGCAMGATGCYEWQYFGQCSDCWP
ncbi:MAG: hypothetical protein ABL958_09745 [Bdellovibrionia bacterium]